MRSGSMICSQRGTCLGNAPLSRHAGLRNPFDDAFGFTAASSLAAGGGMVPNVNVGGATVLLTFGPAEIDRLMATSEMQKHLTDHLDRNAHRIVRNIKRTGGHRQE